MLNRIKQKKGNIFIATWREGKNFGDDYISYSLKKFLKSHSFCRPIIETNLDLDNHILSERDVLIIGGGGIWGPSGTGVLGNDLYLKWMDVKAKLIIANIGFDSFDMSSYDQLSNLHKKAEWFSVRDKNSFLMVNEVLKDSKVFWCADTTYISPIIVKRSVIKGLIGVNLCGPEVDNNTRNYPIKQLAEDIIKLSHELKAVSFSSNSLYPDYKYCRLIDPRCSKHFSIKPYKNCEFFIGMRFHSILLALQNFIPIIAINYSDKVKRLMDEYELGEYCLQPEDTDILEKLRNLTEKIHNNEKEIVEKIYKKNLMAQQRIFVFRENLCNLLEEIYK